jgi:hypothetical protein
MICKNSARSKGRGGRRGSWFLVSSSWFLVGDGEAGAKSKVVSAKGEEGEEFRRPEAGVYEPTFNPQGLLRDFLG